MGAYNCVKIDYVDGNSQYRFYKNPITNKEYLLGEKSVIESERIDKKIINHISTPFGSHGDINEKSFVSLTPLEIALRHQRSVISSTNRTKSMIYNYARGNVWQWFVTLTFNAEKVNRYDYEECSKKLRQWLNNMKKKYASDMKYLMVPEEHKGEKSECKCSQCDTIYSNSQCECPLCRCTDKIYAWHFHGLLSSTGSMKFILAKNKKGKVLKTKNGLDIYNFGNYKMGLSTATVITDTAKASSYITKYITKELTVRTKGFRRYYPSANLDLPTKTFFYILYQDKINFLIKHGSRITYIKNVKISCGTYKNLVDYIEVEKEKEKNV